jgi:hypothetical protein
VLSRLKGRPNLRQLGFVAMLALAAVAIAAFAVACSSGDDEGGDSEPTNGPKPAVAVQDDRLPVVELEGIQDRLDLVAATGAKVSRADIWWSTAAPSQPSDPTDPNDPAYDWTRADEIIQGLADRGIQPLVSSYNTPAWAAVREGEEEAIPAVNPAIPDAEAFGDFMGAIATRYSGSFVPDGASDPLPAVRHFEIWNEPNFGSFLGPQNDGDTMPALEGYVEMARAAYPAIKEANEDTVVIVGVGGPRGTSGPNGTGALDWLGGLRSADIPGDAYSQHIYPAAAPDVPTTAFPSWSSINGFLEELDKWKPGLDLYITEAGYTTAPTEFRKVSVTEEEQAQYLTEIFDLPQVNQERVATVVWFNLQDNPGWPAGLLREDGSEKPSYDRYLDETSESGDRLLPEPTAGG